jgi:hypothetical protein
VGTNVAGSLWTQSPVELTPDLRQACDDVGEVKHIVSPNFEHTSFGKQVGCARAYACGVRSSQLVVTLAMTVCNMSVHDYPGSWAPAVEGRLPQCNSVWLSRAPRKGA